MTEKATSWPDLAGRLVRGAHGATHILPIRVYFEDTDFSGLVYHGSYLRWCERGRSDFLRLLGNDHHALMQSGVPAAFVVRRLTLDYLKPARIDEQLEVTTRVKSVSAAALSLSQSISRDGVSLCEAEVLVVLVSQAGRVLRLPKAMRGTLV
jgi:acyl-CoA thioester hydrolase